MGSRASHRIHFARFLKFVNLWTNEIASRIKLKFYLEIWVFVWLYSDVWSIKILIDMVWFDYIESLRSRMLLAHCICLRMFKVLFCVKKCLIKRRACRNKVPSAEIETLKFWRDSPFKGTVQRDGSGRKKAHSIVLH
jgi:hypothetical protein